MSKCYLSCFSRRIRIFSARLLLKGRHAHVNARYMLEPSYRSAEATGSNVLQRGAIVYPAETAPWCILSCNVLWLIRSGLTFVLIRG